MITSRRVGELRNEVDRRLAAERHYSQEIAYQERVVQCCMAQQRAIPKNAPTEHVVEVQTRLNYAQQALGEAQAYYDHIILANMQARPYLIRRIEALTQFLYEEGVLSLEAFVGIRAEQRGQSITPRSLLPTYSQVRQAQQIESRSYRRVSATPSIQPTHSSPPPYGEAILSPPSYTTQEMTRL